MRRCLTFIAVAASFLPPVSNSADLLVLAHAPLSLGAFLARLLLPSLLAIAFTLAALLVVFGLRLTKTKKFMPSGLMLILTVAALALRHIHF